VDPLSAWFWKLKWQVLRFLDYRNQKIFPLSSHKTCKSLKSIFNYHIFLFFIHIFIRLLLYYQR
jgi:hypothetical protein